MLRAFTGGDMSDGEHEYFGRDGDDELWSVPLWLQIAVGVFVGMLLLHAFEYFVARAWADAFLSDWLRAMPRR